MWRIKHREDGDSENDRMSKKERKSAELFNAVSDEYSLNTKTIIDEWV